MGLLCAVIFVGGLTPLAHGMLAPTVDSEISIEELSGGDEGVAPASIAIHIPVFIGMVAFFGPEREAPRSHAHHILPDQTGPPRA